MNVEIQRTSQPGALPEGDLGFGVHFTDHMAVAEYEEGKGWLRPRVQPRGPITLDPAASGLQYGQSIFEGLKVFRGTDGKPFCFRPLDHNRRFATSANRLCMPSVDAELWMGLVRALVQTDEKFVPSKPNTALYLRPTLIGTEGFLGVRPAKKYLFYVLASPVGSYWGAGGPRAVRLWIEEHFVRAVHGGMGFAKTGGNYAASLKAAEEAKKRGLDQVLWLDGVHRTHIEEIGTMNVFVRTPEGLFTPPLGDTILPGVTRDTVLTLAKGMGIKAEERPISVKELEAWSKKGELLEMFGAGTAAVITPIAELVSEHGSIKVGNGGVGELGQKFLHDIAALQRGEAPDAHGWRVAL
ncbi:MAG: branched-chain amino acid aminotransferase [Deltaproteobacteria bacterium]|nr:branched-chain amino acid aminotransferase [Deltaproteobacteria bacterium]